MFARVSRMRRRDWVRESLRLALHAAGRDWAEAARPALVGQPVGWLGGQSNRLPRRPRDAGAQTGRSGCRRPTVIGLAGVGRSFAANAPERRLAVGFGRTEAVINALEPDRSTSYRPHAVSRSQTQPSPKALAGRAGAPSTTGTCCLPFHLSLFTLSTVSKKHPFQPSPGRPWSGWPLPSVLGDWLATHHPSLITFLNFPFLLVSWIPHKNPRSGKDGPAPPPHFGIDFLNIF